MESGSSTRKCLEKNCRRGAHKQRLESKRNSFMCTGVNKQLKTLAHQVGHTVMSKDAEDKLKLPSAKDPHGPISAFIY